MTTLKNTVIVNGETSVVTVKTAGPQGPSLPDGDKGDVTVSNNGTAMAINTGAVTSTKILDGTIVDADINASAAIAGTKISPDFGSQDITTTGHIDLPDASTIKLGDSDEFQIQHTAGGASLISETGSGNLEIRATNINLKDSNANNKLATNSLGVAITGNLDVSNGLDVTGNLTVSGNMTVSGTTTTIDTTTLTVEDKNIELGKVSTPTDTTADGGGITLKGATDKTFQWLDATDSWTSSENIALPDNKKLKLGASQDIEIFHNGSNSFFINNTGYLQAKVTNGSIFYDAENHVFRKADASENMAKFLQDGAVELYFDGSKKFETTSLGGTLSGTLAVSGNILPNGYIKVLDNQPIYYGTGNDLQIYHDGSNSYIAENGTGDLLVNTSQMRIKNAANNETMAIFTENGKVQLWYDNSAKFETTSSGATITGDLTLNESNPVIFFNDTGDNPDYEVGNHDGVFVIQDNTNSVNRFVINTDGHIDIAGNLDCASGIDVTGHATVSQSLTVTGTTSLGETVNITGNDPNITFVDSNSNPDFKIFANGGTLNFVDSTNSANRLVINSDGHIDISGDLDVGVSLDVAGSIISGGLIKTTGNQITIEGVAPVLTFTETNDNPDYQISGNGGALTFKDTTNAVERLKINSDGNVRIPVDNGKLQIGASQDLELYHDGSHSFIDRKSGGTGDIYVRLGTDNAIIAKTDAAVELYYDNNKKFQTTLTGIEVANTAADINIKSSTSSNSGGGQITFENVDGNGQPRDVVRIKGDTSGNGGYGELTLQTAFNNTLNDRLVIKKDGNVQLPVDNAVLQLGASQDLEIVHTGSQSTIQSKNVDNLTVRQQYAGGYLFLHGDNVHLRSQSTNELYLAGNNNNDVKLYFDNSQKFETLSDGVNITGTLKVNGSAISTDSLDNIVEDTSPQLGGALDTNNQNIEFGDVGNLTQNRLRFGASNDLSIFHDSSSSTNFISTVGSNSCSITSERTDFKNGSNNETFGSFIANSAVELYFDNSKKFQTTSVGATVTDNFSITDSAGAQRLLMGNQDSFGVNCPKILNSGNGILTIGIGDSWSGDGGTLTSQLKVLKDGTVQLPIDNQKLEIGASQDLQLYHDATNSIIANSTGNTYIKGLGGSGNTIILEPKNNENSAKFIPDGAVELYYDNSKKLETLSGGVRVHGDLRINDNENIYLGDGADLQISVGSNNDGVINQVDGDLKFQKSGAGKFTIKSTGTHFSDDAFWVDSQKAIFGTGNDLQIYHNGSHSFIDNSNGVGNLILYGNGTNSVVIQPVVGENSIVANSNSSVELFFDGSKKLETTSLGVAITGTTNSKLSAANGTLILESTNNDVLVESSDDFIVKVQTSETAINAIGNGAVELYFDNSKKFQTTSTGATVTGRLLTDGVSMGDNDELLIGDGNDFKFRHDGTDNHIVSANGNINIEVVDGESAIIAKPNGSVELYYDNAKKLETTSWGTQISGTLKTSGGGLSILTDSEKFTAGAGDDLQIFHDGGTSFINNTTGDLRLTTDNNLILRSADQTENYLVATRNSDVELFFDGSLKLQTSSSGITVTGSVTTQDMNMSNLNGTANEVDNTKGSWSIQEGSNDLFIINRVTGKKYKFNLTEIS